MIEDFLDLNHQSWEEIQEILEAVLPQMFVEKISACRPTLINFYQREYYESAEGSIRISLDYDHQIYDQRFSAFPNLSFAEPHHNVPLIEIKAFMVNYESIVRTLAGFPIRAEPFSKYIDGVLSMLSR